MSFGCKSMKLVKKNSQAFLPTRATPRSAGLDLFSPIDFMIFPRSRYLLDCLISIQLPHDTYGRIAARSGLAYKQGMEVMGGVIDEDYRGSIKVLLLNTSFKPVKFKRGDKIAQLICEKICYPVVEEVCTLNSTIRGDGGFGSSN